MRIGPVDTTDRVAIIAEIGNNHEGDPGLARELVLAAAEAGAHAVKFQAIDPPKLVRPSEAERLAQLERFRLTSEDFAELHDLARGLGVGFLCTPFHLEAVRWLEPLVDAFKIASGDNDVAVLIDACASTGRPVIVSTGMAGVATARAAQSRVRARGAEFAALHAVGAYPTPPEAASLATIPRLATELGCTVGYSDHTLGVEACVLAVGLGARIVEKHFTIDKGHSNFRDHRLSADPAEMRQLVDRIAAAEAMIGRPADRMLTEEEAVAGAARRSICAARDLPAGRVVALDDLTWLRPADGMAPGREEELVGRALVRDVAAGEPLAPTDVAAPAG